MSGILSFAKVRRRMLVVSGLVLMAHAGVAQRDARAVSLPRPGGDAGRSDAEPQSNLSVRPSFASAESSVIPAGQEPCSDALSNALHADPERMPCWANIR